MASLPGLPTLKTNTPTPPAPPGQTATSTGKGSTKTKGGDDTSTGTSDSTSATTGKSAASSSASFVPTGTDSVTNAPTLSTGGTTSVFHLSAVPSIAGVGIPKMVVPDTANAPYMQKSQLPQGTVFIAVGAVLAFLGACVLLWRGMVAWSINHSVKKAALASLRGGNEKDTRHWRNNPYQVIGGSKKGLYKDENGSSMSLEPLTSSGKPLKPHMRDSIVERTSTAPQNLFFSPTAQAQPPYRDYTPTQRASTHMPAGYYASPSAQPAGGAPSTTMGAPHSTSQYTRQSYVSGTYPSSAQTHQRAPSPPSPEGRPSAARRNTSRDGRRPPGGAGRSSYLESGPRTGANAGGRTTSAMYTQPSTSSLLVGASSSEALPGSRAPSAYLEDLFDNHGNGPRERY